MPAPTTRHLTQLVSLTAPTATPYVSVSQAFPPLDLNVVITDAAGVTTRWGSEDSNAENVPQNLSFSTQRMQGFGSGSVSLARRIDRDYMDVHLLDDVTFVGANGDIAYEGRVGAMPRDFDTDHSLSLTLTGHMAAASDRTFTDLFVDRDLSQWGEPSRTRRAVSLGADVKPFSPSVASDVTTGAPCVSTIITDGWVSPYLPSCEAWYDAGPGVLIGKVFFAWTNINNNPADTSWTWKVHAAAGDTTSIESTAELRGAGPQFGSLTFTNAARFAFLYFAYNSTPAGDAGVVHQIDWSSIAVYGNHGLTLIGPTSQPQGVSASDVIINLFGRFAPTIKTTGVMATTFGIPHLVFRDRTKPYDAALEVNKYHLWNLAVWDNKTLSYTPTDLTDFDWEVRTDDPGVSIALQGDSTEDLANGITVSFTNVLTGKQDVLTPDSYEELRDSGLDNPANQHGLKVWTDYTLSTPSTPEAALQVGRAALAEYNAPKAPGSINVTNVIRDRAGHWQPVWKVRAGDRVAVTSSASLSDRPRLIHETSYTHDDRGLTIAVDSTAKTLDAVVDRLSTALTAANL